MTLDAGKPLVAHGERGLSRKGGAPGNASYYYSFTRLPARGRVRTPGADFGVEGTVWFDREWSTSALGEDQIGWDWFGLQLSDGRELMYYRLRRRDGGIDRMSAGTLVGVDGAATALGPDDVLVEPTGYWSSPLDGARYQVRWQIRLPGEGLVLDVEPVLDDQEMDLAIRYWEGAVRVSGTARGRAVAGRGYLEMTGYDGRAGHGTPR